MITRLPDRCYTIDRDVALTAQEACLQQHVRNRHGQHEPCPDAQCALMMAATALTIPAGARSVDLDRETAMVASAAIAAEQQRPAVQRDRVYYARLQHAEVILSWFVPDAPAPLLTAEQQAVAAYTGCILPVLGGLCVLALFVGIAWGLAALGVW